MKIYLHFFLINTCLICLFSYELRAQISTHENPSSFKDLSLQSLRFHKTSDIQVISMPELDTAALINEDKIKDGKALPFRFGFSFAVNINIENSGVWDTLTNGTRIWRLRIHLSKGARSINFIYNKFYLPNGSKLYIYSENKKQVLGAFTSMNNKGGAGEGASGFATSFIYGRYAVLEYVEPKNSVGNVVISISNVIHAYRAILTPNSFTGNPNSHNFPNGLSLACDNNINCPTGAAYQNEKRAVGLFILGGLACSGTLVQNTAKNSDPYFLTANHCLNNLYDAGAGGNTNLTSALFYWNFESPNCTNTYPNATGTNGATLLANSLVTDFALFKLQEDPAKVAGVNPFYLDWTRSTTAATSAADINHPKVDIKKIALTTTAVSSNSGPLSWNADGNDPAYISAANTHWVVNWTSGATEPGSSGSALMNQNHLLVGQLHGMTGSPSCPPNQSFNFFGRFDLSFTGDGTMQRSLRPWLDPLGTNSISSFPVTVSGPSSFCNTAVYTANNVPAGSTVTWSFSPSNLNIVLSPNGNQVSVSDGESGTNNIAIIASINGPSASQIVSASSNALSGNWTNGSYTGPLNTVNFVPTGYINGYFTWPFVSNIVITTTGSGSSFTYNTNSFSFYLASGQTFSLNFSSTSPCGTPVTATRTFKQSSSYAVVAAPNPASTTLSLNISTAADTTGKLLTYQQKSVAVNSLLSSTGMTKLFLYDLKQGILMRKWSYYEIISTNYNLNISGIPLEFTY